MEKNGDMCQVGRKFKINDCKGRKMFLVVFRPFHSTLFLLVTKDFEGILSSYCSIQTHRNINAGNHCKT